MDAKKFTIWSVLAMLIFVSSSYGWTFYFSTPEVTTPYVDYQPVIPYYSGNYVSPNCRAVRRRTTETQTVDVIPSYPYGYSGFAPIVVNPAPTGTNVIVRHRRSDTTVYSCSPYVSGSYYGAYGRYGAYRSRHYYRNYYNSCNRCDRNVSQYYYSKHHRHHSHHKCRVKRHKRRLLIRIRIP